MSRAICPAYAEEIAPQAKVGKFWERQSATFADLWDKFSAHELASPDLRPSTVADYKALGRLYLVPHLGDRRLSEIDTEVIMDMKTQPQVAAGSKASGKEGSKKPLSPRSVAKILILGGSVWRYGRRIKMVDGSPFADVRKPRGAKREPYILDAAEIGRLRAALDVPSERLLIELTLTTGMRSGEVRLGHASERTTLAIYTHSMRRTHDDSADRIAALAGLSSPAADVGNIRETK